MTTETHKKIPPHQTDTTITTILVLYGSQTGNAQQAAYEFCQQCTSEHLYRVYTTTRNATTTTTTTNTKPTVLKEQQQQQEDEEEEAEAEVDNRASRRQIRPKEINVLCMSCDDFLEIHHCVWYPIVLFFVSSYGCGGPPLGCHRFRDVCDYLLLQQQPEQQQPEQLRTTKEQVLQQVPQQQQQLPLNLHGVQYAICGLGDSKFTTYLQNPITIDTALQSVQAKSFYSMAHADASSTSSSQSKTITMTGVQQPPQQQLDQAGVIQEWVHNLWIPLCQLVYNTEKSTEPQTQPHDWERMQQETIAICCDVIPDYIDPLNRNQKKNKWMMSILATILSHTTTTPLFLVLLMSVLILLFSIWWKTQG
jgi:sulfite reductase alpha subunit-like flavoprotein